MNAAKCQIIVHLSLGTRILILDKNCTNVWVKDWNKDPRLGNMLEQHFKNAVSAELDSCSSTMQERRVPIEENGKNVGGGFIQGPQWARLQNVFSFFYNFLIFT